MHFIKRLIIRQDHCRLVNYNVPKQSILQIANELIIEISVKFLFTQIFILMILSGY